MPVSETSTCRALCTAALYKLNVTSLGSTPAGEDINLARDALNRMLKDWQNDGPNLWTTESMSISATATAAQVLDPIRPVSIHSCRYKYSSGTELPMIRVNRAQYDNLPNKGTLGTPTQFYFDRQRETARLLVWPIPATATGTFEITYTREFQDVDLDDEIDVPAEFYDCVVYNLAARLSDDYQMDAMKIEARAQALMDTALAADREASVFFVDAEYRF